MRGRDIERIRAARVLVSNAEGDIVPVIGMMAKVGARSNEAPTKSF